MNGPSAVTIRRLVGAGCCAFLLACASAPDQVLTGSVRIYGNEPNTYAGIADETNGKMYLINNTEKETELRALQGQRLEFRVKILPQRATYPPADGIVTVISYRAAD